MNLTIFFAGSYRSNQCSTHKSCCILNIWCESQVRHKFVGDSYFDLVIFVIIFVGDWFCWLLIMMQKIKPFFVLKSFSSIFSLPHIGRTCGPIWYIPPRSLCQTETVFKEINAEERYLIMVTKKVVLCLHPDPNSFSRLSPCLSLSRTLSYHMTSCFETAPL